MILDNQNFIDPQRTDFVDGMACPGGAPSRSMASRKQEDPIEGQPERLKRLREVLGYETSQAFATFLDISAQRYNHFENGKPLSREVAFRLVQRVPGLTLDWLYFGKAGGLPIELARELGELQAPGKRTTV